MYLALKIVQNDLRPWRVRFVLSVYTFHMQLCSEPYLSEPAEVPKTGSCPREVQQKAKSLG